MAKLRTWSIGEVARLASVSVRVLRHWDEIGLLCPALRRANGYRRYDADDLLRLQQIRLLRRSGMGLGDIAKALDRHGQDPRSALLAQRDVLMTQIATSEQLLAGVDAALAYLEGQDIDMNTLFDGFNPEDFAKEAEARWGEQESYATSKARTKSYSKADWVRIKAERDVNYTAMAEAMRNGTQPGSPDADRLVAGHRALIDRYFYPCDAAAQRGLAELYAADDRFRTTIDHYGEGLTDWLIEAIRTGTPSVS